VIGLHYAANEVSGKRFNTNTVVRKENKKDTKGASQDHNGERS
jgi:hypothetical protein